MLLLDMVCIHTDADSASLALTTLRKSYTLKPSAGDDLKEEREGDSFSSNTTFIIVLVQVLLSKCKEH